WTRSRKCPSPHAKPPAKPPRRPSKRSAANFERQGEASRRISLVSVRRNDTTIGKSGGSLRPSYSSRATIRLHHSSPSLPQGARHRPPGEEAAVDDDTLPVDEIGISRQ